jgi:hypothetical protein
MCVLKKSRYHVTALNSIILYLFTIPFTDVICMLFKSDGLKLLANLLLVLKQSLGPVFKYQRLHMSSMF